MLGNVIIIAVIVQAIHYTMLEGEIFGWLGDFFFKHFPTILHKPLFDCPICMTFWYGTAIYLLLTNFGVDIERLHAINLNLEDWFFTVIGAMGVNVVISKFENHNDEIIKDDTPRTGDKIQSSI